MPSKKSLEQVRMWLRNVAADPNTMDSVCADLALNVLDGLEDEIAKKGAIINALQSRKKKKDYEPGSWGEMFDDSALRSEFIFAEKSETLME